MPEFDLKFLLMRFKIKEANVWDFLRGLKDLELKLDDIIYGKVVEVGITSGEFDVQVLVEVKNPEIARYLPDIMQYGIPENIRKFIEFSNNVFWYSAKQ